MQNIPYLLPRGTKWSSTRVHKKEWQYHIVSRAYRAYCVITDCPVSCSRLMNKTAELSQRRPRDAPNIWVPWKVLRVLTTHPATFPEIFNGLLFWSKLRTCVQNLKFVALPVPEIIGGTQKNFGSPWIRPPSIFSQNFKGLLFGCQLKEHCSQQYNITTRKWKAGNTQQATSCLETACHLHGRLISLKLNWHHGIWLLPSENLENVNGL